MLLATTTTCIFLPSFPSTTPREKNFCSFPTAATSEMPQIRNGLQAHKERMHWNCMCSELTRAGTSSHIFHSLVPLTECSVSPGQVKSNLYCSITAAGLQERGFFQLSVQRALPLLPLPLLRPQKSGSTMVRGYCFELQQQMSDFCH